MARTARQQRGRQSERLALRLLQSQGYRIEATNVRFPVGELDLIAWEGETLCFIEVRSTASLDWGGPLASIDERKRHHLIQAARWYLSRRELPPQTRFDVVSVVWDDPLQPTVELLRGAFDAG